MYRILNITFLLLAAIALLVEFAVFLFEHWFIDASLFLQLAFATLNLCLAILNPQSLRFWLKLRLWCAYIPYGLIVVVTIIEIILFSIQIDTEETSSASLVLFMTCLPVLLQGLTFVLYFRFLNKYTEQYYKYELRDRLRMQEELSYIDQESEQKE